MDLKDKMDAALEQVTKHLLATEDDLKAIVVRGSYVTGRMTSASDIDMYMITEEKGPEAFHLFQDGFDFHIRRFPESYLTYEIAERNLRYIGFFRHAKVLHDPGGVFLGLKDIVDRIPPVEIASIWLAEVKHQAADMKGQLEKQDYQTALYLARLAALLLAQTALLVTPQATYKHKDVISSLRESPSLASIRNSLFQLMDLEIVSKYTVISKYELLASTIALVEEHLNKHKESLS